MLRGVVSALMAAVVMAGPVLVLVCELHCGSWQSARPPAADLPLSEQENHHHGLPPSPPEDSPLPSPQEHCGGQHHAVVAVQVSAKPLPQFLTVVNLLGPSKDNPEVGNNSRVHPLASMEQLVFLFPKPVPSVLRI